LVHAEVTVAAIVRVDDRYLVVEEFAHGERVINQPAGHVESGETIVDAVVRETREETAWRFIPTGLVGMYYWPHEDGRTTLRFAFCGEVSDHAAEQALDEGIVAAHWLSMEELHARNDLRSPLVMRAIDDFTHHDPLPLERVRHIHGR
jgi:8-oxo-dGTP pyrophosphatase MutT (NUDIX family)